MLPFKGKTLDPYHNALKLCKAPFPCPVCDQLVHAKDFEKHAKPCLDLDPDTQCVWCFGNETWERRSKGKHVLHLKDCFNRCLFRIPPPPPPPPRFPYTPKGSSDEEDDNPFDSQKSFILDDPHHVLCPQKDFFGRNKVLPELAYRFFCPYKLEPATVPFQNKNLTLAAACVRTYLKLRSTHEFFHCMVRAVVMPQFIDAMLADQGRSFMFPFSCWCDGGHFPEDRHRHHRHMILFSVGNFKKQVWKRIKIHPDDRPPISNFHALLKIRIQSTMHLVNTIGYLCKRESRCDGTLDEKHQPVRYSLNHFYIFRSLPANFKVCLATMWDGGLLELVHQTYRNIEPKHLANVARLVEGKWRTRIRDIRNIELHRVVPVDKHFTPSELPTEHYLHLVEGRKLYFQREPMDDDEAWGRAQAEKGNVLYSAIRNDLWTPGRFQQKCLHAIDDYKRENPVVLELKYIEPQLKNIELARCQATCRQKDDELARCQAELQAKDDELARCQAELARCQAELARCQVPRTAHHPASRTKRKRSPGFDTSRPQPIIPNS